MNVMRWPCCSATLAATMFAEAPINVPFPKKKRNENQMIIFALEN